jgi:hypothetical protein
MGHSLSHVLKQPTVREAVNFHFILHFRFSAQEKVAASSENFTTQDNFHTSSTRQPVARSNKMRASRAQDKKEEGNVWVSIHVRTVVGFQISTHVK